MRGLLRIAASKKKKRPATVAPESFAATLPCLGQCNQANDLRVHADIDGPAL
jgi:hypothetical protein